MVPLLRDRMASMGPRSHDHGYLFWRLLLRGTLGSFNGAAVSRPRIPANLSGICAVSFELQWGRGLTTTDTLRVRRL